MSSEAPAPGTPKGPTLRTRTRRTSPSKEKKQSKMTSVNLTSEQLQEFVQSITTAAMHAVTAASESMASENRWAPTRSFSDLSVTFNGARDSAQVEEFLAASSIFKKIHRIGDSDAIMSLPLVLKNEASTWWQSIKDSVKTWADFENRIRHAFAPKKPAYIIYQELFAKKQPAEMLTEVFVAKNRALLAQLPAPGHNEQQQLDMIYGQLNVKIREKIAREAVSTFDGLLTAARGVEQLLREKSGADKTDPGDERIKKVSRCSYCRRTGHSLEECRKKQKQVTEKETNVGSTATQAPSPSQPVFSCYGCGAPGVVRSKCSTCTAARTTKVKEEKVDFCALNISTDARPRLVVGIGIYDIVGTAYLDTCAKSSVASYELYRCLEKRQVPFGSQLVTLTMADGIKRKQNVLTVRVPVKICQRSISTTFIVFPDSRENKTLLGVGFLQDDHRACADHIASIRFAMNTATSLVTGHTPAYLTFARELRTPDDNKHDLTQIVLSENFIPEITPKLLLLAQTLRKVREIRESKEEDRKKQADKTRRPDPGYQPGELVLATVHAVSKASQGLSAKFAPRRDGPYIIKERLGATTYVLATPDKPEEPIGTYHTSALKAYAGDTSCVPAQVQPIRKRGRPRKLAPTSTNGTTRRQGRKKP